MKIKFVYKLAAVLLLFIVMQSRSNGPGAQQNLEVTGAPGSTGSPGTCANAGCHSDGSFNPSLSLNLLDGGTAVTSYLPGKTYTLRIINSAGSGNPQRYGFQAVSLNNANSQSGNWGSSPIGTQNVQIGTRSYSEHSLPSISNTFNIPWVAPAASSGRVNFYVASLAANSNGSTNGDGTASSSLSINEGNITNETELIQATTSIALSPNPVSDLMMTEIFTKSAGEYDFNIIDMSGIRHIQQKATLNEGLNTRTIDLSGLPNGLYIVHLRGQNSQVSSRIFKE